MENQPPAFQVPTASPQRSNNRVLWIVAACIAIPCCGLMGFFAYIGIKGYREFIPFLGCIGTFHDLHAAMELYAKDHDGKLPPGSKWQDELRPYLAKVSMGEEFGRYKGLETMAVWGCTTAEDNASTGIAFNAALSEKPLAKVKDPEKTPLLFEVPVGVPNLSVPYQIDRGKDSPIFVFGQRRGWIEVDPLGKMYMLMKEGGRLVRVPLDDQGQVKKAMEDMKESEVKQTPSEPGR